MGYGSWNHATENAGGKAIKAEIFKLFVEHVVHSGKKSLFEAGSQSPTPESPKSFFLIDVFNCAVHAAVEMEICKFKSCLDDTEGVGDEGAEDPSQRGNTKIFKSRLIFFF